MSRRKGKGNEPPVGSQCPLCGVDIARRDGGAGDQPGCEHCLADLDVMFYDNGLYPVAAWAATRMNLDCLIELDEALTRLVEVVGAHEEREWTEFPLPLQGLVAEVFENVITEDGETERDHGADFSAFNEYLSDVLSSCEGYYGSTDYDDSVALQSAYHQVHWAEDPEKCMAQALATIQKHVVLLNAFPSKKHKLN